MIVMSDVAATPVVMIVDTTAMATNTTNGEAHDNGADGLWHGGKDDTHDGDDGGVKKQGHISHGVGRHADCEGQRTRDVAYCSVDYGEQEDETDGYDVFDYHDDMIDAMTTLPLQLWE